MRGYESLYASGHAPGVKPRDFFFPGALGELLPSSPPTILASAFALSCAYVLPSPLPAPPASRAAAVRMEAGVPVATPMMPGQKTWMPKAEDRAMAAKKWYVVDAEGLRLGRMSSEIAKLLLGKHKPEFTPGADVGDCVVVINAEKCIVTGNKARRRPQRALRACAARPDIHSTRRFPSRPASHLRP